MRSLFEVDFVNDSFPTLIKEYFLKDEVDDICFLYKLSKYALANKYDDAKLDLSKTVIKIYLQEYLSNFKVSLEFKDYIGPVDFVKIVLLYFIVDCSYMMTIEYVQSHYGNDVANCVELLMLIDKIAQSNATITVAKQTKYIDQFSRSIIVIKSMMIIAELQILSLNKSRDFPVKVHSRYLPIIDIYPKIGDCVAIELRIWLLNKIKEAQSLKDDEYNITIGHYFKYFSILKDSRFKRMKTKFPKIYRDLRKKL